MKNMMSEIDNFLIRVSVVRANVNPTLYMNRYVLRKLL